MTYCPFITRPPPEEQDISKSGTITLNYYQGPFLNFLRRIVDNKYFSEPTKEYFGIVNLNKQTFIGYGLRKSTLFYKTSSNRYFVEYINKQNSNIFEVTPREVYDNLESCQNK